MQFFPVILTSIFAAAATTAFSIPDTLPSGITVRQDSKCAAANSSVAAADKQLAADQASYNNNPTLKNQEAVARDKQRLEAAQNNQVSVVCNTWITQTTYRAKLTWFE